MSKKIYMPLLCTMILMSFLSCTKQEEKSEKPIIRPVRTILINGTDNSRERTFSGIAKAAVETRLSFRVGGEIDRLPVKIGMKLKKGDLIATLDPADYELSVKQAQANFAQVRAQYSQATSEYDRDRQLYEAGNISRSQLDRSLAAYQSGNAQTEAARKSVELAKHQLKYTTLTAPMDGSIGALPVDVHQTIAPGQIIATLNAGGALEMETGIPESLISQVHVQDPAHVRFDAIPDRQFAARIIEVGMEATETTTYPVKLQLLENDERLRPGMVGQAEFTFQNGQDTITIPPVAVVESPKGENYVWVFTPDHTNRKNINRIIGKMHRRTVTIGALTSRGIQILNGIEPGDIIAVRGVHKMTENMQVRILPPTNATQELEKAQHSTKQNQQTGENRQ